MPRLWAKVKGINDDIAVKTANFIIDTAVMYNADTIVFEHLDLAGKKRGSKKQRYPLPTLSRHHQGRTGLLYNQSLCSFTVHPLYH